MKWPWQRREGPSPEVLEVEKSLQETKILIAQAYAGFNSATDPELVESYVYEIQAYQARYSYLLRQRKALDGGGLDGTGEKKQAAELSGQTLPAMEALPPRPVLPVA